MERARLAFLECGGRGSPTLYQDYRRRRFGMGNITDNLSNFADTKAASPVVLIKHRTPSALHFIHISEPGRRPAILGGNQQSPEGTKAA